MLFFSQTPLTQTKERTHWRKNMLVALFIFAFFIPQYTFAFSDARCFEEKDCYEKRRELGALDEASVKSGFKHTPESIKSCGGKSIKRKGKDINVGFCLAAGSIETKIKIGGRAQFDDIVDFIIYIHQYAIIVGGILAMIVVIVAGFQLTASGGNSAIIGSAKKRIAGAITGVIILVLSFTILQSINPKTLELVLPKIWLLQGVAISPLKCDETIEPNPIYKLVAEQKEYLSLIKKPKEWQDAIKAVHDDTENKIDKIAPKKTACGDRYTHEGIAASCMGTKCAEDEVCGENILGKDGEFMCHKKSNFYFYIYDGGFVKQDIDPTGLIQEGWKYDWISNIENTLYYWCRQPQKSSCTIRVKTKANDFEIITLKTANCEDGAIKDGITFNKDQVQKDSRTKTVIAPINLKDAVSKGIAACKGKINVGFAFKLSFLELKPLTNTTDEHFIGRNGIDLGDVSVLRYTERNRFFNLLFTAEDLVPETRNPGGVRIDVSEVVDLDEGDENIPKAIQSYSYLGITKERVETVKKEETEQLQKAVMTPRSSWDY